MTTLFVIPDKERNYQGYMAFVLTILWSVVTGLIVTMGLIFLPEQWMRWTTFLYISLLIAIVHLWLISAGHIRTASWSLIIFVWLYVTIPCYSAGGISAPMIMSQMSLILSAGFLLGWRGGVAFGLLTMGADFFFAYLEVIGELPAPSVVHTPITRWIGALIPFGTILALQYYATNHLNSGLIALQREIKLRELAELKQLDIIANLEERNKEINTLYKVNKILLSDETPLTVLFQRVVNVIPDGWQFPDLVSASLHVDDESYTIGQHASVTNPLRIDGETSKGKPVSLEVGYQKEIPFLEEERSLITMLLEMLITAIERRDHRAELKDYKYALDIGYSVSISDQSGAFTFVNENFCKMSKYSLDELIGENHSVLWSGEHAPGYFKDLRDMLESGNPFTGEFCNKAKDGSLYWVDTTIVPFLDEHGAIYQFLTINHDITERKIADEKIKESEELLRKITSQMPGNTYMFDIEENGEIHIQFMSHGSEIDKQLYKTYDDSKPPSIANAVFFENDKETFTLAMKEARIHKKLISVQYRVMVNGQVRWRWMRALPEILPNGEAIWYGATTDITSIAEYMTSIEQIIFDISHVIRRPLSSMLGLTNLVLEHNLSKKETLEIAQKLNDISLEMDKFIGELNVAYNKKRQEMKHVMDVFPAIDKRDHLFQ